MPWASSQRRAELPPGWSSRIVPRILQRDPTCRLQLRGCTNVSTEVDHIGDKHDHSDANLRGLCHPCHAKRTHEQSLAARPSRRRPAERHPGVMP